MNSPARLAVFAITVLALSCIACPALAALGANAASIDAIGVQLKAKLSSFAQPSYSVHLLRAARPAASCANMLMAPASCLR